MCLACCDIVNHKRFHANSLNRDQEITALYVPIEKAVLNTNNVYIHNHIFCIIYFLQRKIRLV